MPPHVYRHSDSLSPSLKVFHELMPHKVNEILLVSSRYDAFIMEEDGRLAGRIIHEYRGLNLSRPPRLDLGVYGERGVGRFEKESI